jgi:hypothetical protein
LQAVFASSVRQRTVVSCTRKREHGISLKTFDARLFITGTLLSSAAMIDVALLLPRRCAHFHDGLAGRVDASLRNTSVDLRGRAVCIAGRQNLPSERAGVGDTRGVTPDHGALVWGAWTLLGALALLGVLHAPLFAQRAA